MKSIGLIKWFDDTKGFGKIGVPSGEDVFIHQNNFRIRPEKLLKATAIVFDSKSDRKGISATNAEPPSSYDDFKLILSFLEKNPCISIEVTISGKSRWGNSYKRNEFKSYNLVDYSLHQLFRAKLSTDIFEFFKKYYDEQGANHGSDFTKKYFEITKQKIKGLKVELNDYLLTEFEVVKARNESGRVIAFPRLSDEAPNTFLINKLFSYYLTKVDESLLFEIWKNKTLQINSNAFDIWGDSEPEEVEFEFPSTTFISNYKSLNAFDLKRILSQSSKGEEIIFQIISKRIDDLNVISKQYVEEIVNCISVSSMEENKSQLNLLLSEKLVQIINQTDFSNHKETVSDFKLFLEILNNKKFNLDADELINKFNHSVTNDTKFSLWQETRYFKPQKDFFYFYFEKLSFSDFLQAPDDFHKEYFQSRLNQLSDFTTIENFSLLTFLIIETPVKELTEVFPKLDLNYQCALWLNFPREGSYWGKYHQANYESFDIPFSPEKFITNIVQQASLSNLIIATEVVSKIQDKYSSKTSNYSKNDGFFKLSTEERKVITSEICLQANENSSQKKIELLKAAIRKCKNENCVSIIKALVPKFINEEVITIDELIEIILNAEIETTFRNEIFSYIGETTSKYHRVWLWFKGYSNKIKFDEAVEVFAQFEINSQPNLLRKLFSLIHRNKVNPIEGCLVQLSTLATNQKLNLDVRICLTVINALSRQQNYIGENIISEIVCQYVNENVSELVQVYDLFQECKGRTWMTIGDENQKNWFMNIEGKEFHVDNDAVNVNGNHYSFDKEKRTVEIEGESYSFRWAKKENNLFGKLYDKPIGVTFCDAVKSQKDETLNRNFYWCCNSKCYAPCQTDHIHLEWNKYSLRDFIKILKLPFEEDKYYRFVSVVNRANRLMKKLKCTSCNHLLRDTRTSEFAFYRVTTFHCTNYECSKLHEFVYLNHCLNWRCLNVVDSRISVTCPNGWYICDSCNNCCSQDKLEKRLANLITNNAFNPNNSRHQKLKYQVDNKLGHMEREEKFNFRTGEKINGQS